MLLNLFYVLFALLNLHIIRLFSAKSLGVFVGFDQQILGERLSKLAVGVLSIKSPVCVRNAWVLLVTRARLHDSAFLHGSLGLASVSRIQFVKIKFLHKFGGVNILELSFVSLLDHELVHLLGDVLQRLGHLLRVLTEEAVRNIL